MPGLMMRRALLAIVLITSANGCAVDNGGLAPRAPKLTSDVTRAADTRAMKGNETLSLYPKSGDEASTARTLRTVGGGASRPDTPKSARDASAAEAEVIQRLQSLKHSDVSPHLKILAESAVNTALTELRAREQTALEIRRAAELPAEREALELEREALEESRAELVAQLDALEQRRREITALQAEGADVDRAREELDARQEALLRRELELAEASEDAERRTEEQEALKADLAAVSSSLRRSTGIDFGRYHALVIGNQTYHYLPNLDTAVADAEAIADLLSERYGFEVTRLHDATRDQILSAFNAYREQLTSEDNLLIYYAGHSELDRANMRCYWLPVDAEPTPYITRWISSVDISDILNAMAALQILVVADSCYSGVPTRFGLDPGMIELSETDRTAAIRTLATRRSRTALTSGDLAPTLDRDGGQHSIFATALLEALGSNDQVMEGWRLYLRVSARVSDVARSYGLKQVPQYGQLDDAGHDDGEFFFIPVDFFLIEVPMSLPAQEDAASPPPHTAVQRVRPEFEELHTLTMAVSRENAAFEQPAFQCLNDLNLCTAKRFAWLDYQLTMLACIFDVVLP